MTVLITIVASSAGTGIAIAIGGIAAVLVVSAAFYVVGRGEDRDRARAARDAPHDDEPGVTPDDEPSAPPPATAEAPRSRLPASTRRRRRR